VKRTAIVCTLTAAAAVASCVELIGIEDVQPRPTDKPDAATPDAATLDYDCAWALSNHRQVQSLRDAGSHEWTGGLRAAGNQVENQLHLLTNRSVPDGGTQVDTVFIVDDKPTLTVGEDRQVLDVQRLDVDHTAALVVSDSAELSLRVFSDHDPSSSASTLHTVATLGEPASTLAASRFTPTGVGTHGIALFLTYQPQGEDRCIAAYQYYTGDKGTPVVVHEFADNTFCDDKCRTALLHVDGQTHVFHGQSEELGIPGVAHFVLPSDLSGQSEPRFFESEYWSPIALGADQAGSVYAAFAHVTVEQLDLFVGTIASNTLPTLDPLVDLPLTKVWGQPDIPFAPALVASQQMHWTDDLLLFTGRRSPLPLSVDPTQLTLVMADGAGNYRGDHHLPFNGILDAQTERVEFKFTYADPIFANFTTSGGPLWVAWTEKHKPKGQSGGAYDVLYYDRLYCSPRASN